MEYKGEQFTFQDVWDSFEQLYVGKDSPFVSHYAASYADKLNTHTKIKDPKQFASAIGEVLCESIDIRSNQSVLDVAAGNGNATLAAARRFANVTSTDYVGSLLLRGRERAEAERLTVKFQEADAEALPFGNGEFDAVISTFGVMFAPDHAKAASEMLRVCRPGGKIGLANWTPDSFIGRLFKTIGKYVPPAANAKSPALWGDEAYLKELFGSAEHTSAVRKTFVFRYRSPQHWLDIFRGYYGPVLKAFEAIDKDAARLLEKDILALLDEFNVAKDGTLVAPSAYVEAVIVK